jgi:hypothetical protein
MILKHIYRSNRWPSFRTGCKSRKDCVRLLEYLIRPEAKPTILRNDFAGSTPAEIGDELQALHRGQKCWAYHVVASYPPDEERLWEPQSKKRIAEIQDRCRIPAGFWVKHKGHWHGFLQAMKPNGGAVRLGTYDEQGQPHPVAPAFRQMVRTWEDETPGCRKTGRGDRGLDIDRDTLSMAARQYEVGEAPTPIPAKMLLKAQVERIVTLSASFAELHARADALGISIAYRSSPEEGIVGVSFSQDGVSLRGRDAGFTYGKLKSTYPDTPPAGVGAYPGMAGGIIGVGGRQTGRPAETGDRGADPRPQYHPHRAGGTVQTVARCLGWPPAQAGLLTRDVSPVLTLLDILTSCFTRICNQNDYRRRQRHHDRDYIPL